MISEKQFVDGLKSFVGKFNYKNSKSVFVATFIAGVICHIYFLVHNLPNGDTMSRFVDNRDLLFEGRFMFEYVGFFTSDYALGWVNGIIAIFFISLAAVLVVDIFEITGKTAGMLTGIVLVVYPSVASNLSYIHRSAIFLLTFLLSVVAVKVAKQFKFGFVYGAVILAISLGIYQAFFSTTLMLIVILLALNIISKTDYTTKQVAQDIARYSLLVVIGFVLYELLLFAFLGINQSEVASYQGIDILTGNTASFNLLYSIKAVALEAFKMILELPFVFLKQPALIATAVIIGGFALYLIIANKVYKNLVKIIALALLALSLPLALAPSIFLSPDMWHHNILRYGLVFVFVAVLPISERFYKSFGQTNSLWLFGSKAISLLLVAIVSWNFFLVSNINYFNAQQRFEKDYSLILSASNRIFETEGFEITDPICVFGFPYESGAYEPFNYIGYAEQDGFGVSGLVDNTVILNSLYGFSSFARTYFGIPFNMVMWDQFHSLKQHPEVQSMPAWPNDGCVKEIDGVFVIKLGHSY